MRLKYQDAISILKAQEYYYKNMARVPAGWSDDMYVAFVQGISSCIQALKDAKVELRDEEDEQQEKDRGLEGSTRKT